MTKNGRAMNDISMPNQPYTDNREDEVM